jgi:hypothetical protein
MMMMIIISGFCQASGSGFLQIPSQRSGRRTHSGWQIMTRLGDDSNLKFEEK